jgi:hypothetical protein
MISSVTLDQHHGTNTTILLSSRASHERWVESKGGTLLTCFAEPPSPLRTLDSTVQNLSLHLRRLSVDHIDGIGP